YYPGIQVSNPIYPPVDIMSKKNNENKKSYLLCYGRLVPYKHFDIVIQAAQKLHRDLIIIGEGPDVSRLKKIAQSASTSVTFLNHQSQEKLNTYIREAQAV